MVRLRFLIVLGVVFLVIASWDALRNYWDRLTRGATGVDLAAQAVSSDTEYFCPMDPGVLSDWPSKCPICNMTLVRRKKGDATPLPEGVVARMQISPYRLQLAGIRTVPAEYRPLAREVEGPARLAAEGVEVELFPADAAMVTVGQSAEVIGAGASGSLPGKVTGLRPEADGAMRAATIEVADPKSLKAASSLRARIAVPVAGLEPFRSLPADPPPLKAGEKRWAYACAEHPEILREKAERCPQDNKPLVRHGLTALQRLRWWCPMHPSVTAEAPGHKCAECGGMTLVPRVLSYRPRGEVLAVPESSVVDTGKKTVVYVERMPGMFDGVEVILGPRTGEFFPVIRGLEPGQQVVAVGAFLLDAETRLNPSLAASYFGAARREPAASAPETPSADDGSALAIARQKTCPVTGKKLGSMGTPVRRVVAGRAVFLCCDGCEDALTSNPAKYLAKLPPEAKSAP